MTNPDFATYSRTLTNAAAAFGLEMARGVAVKYADLLIQNGQPEAGAAINEFSVHLESMIEHSKGRAGE